MRNNTYVYILIMFLVSYLLRVLPLTLIRREIKNRTIRSFLYYVPYVTLAVMTFPSIINQTLTPLSGLLALFIGVVLSWFDSGLFVTAIATVGVVFISELIL